MGINLLTLYTVFYVLMPKKGDFYYKEMEINLLTLDTLFHVLMPKKGGGLLLWRDGNKPILHYIHYFMQ